MRYIVLLLAFGCITPTEKVKERTIISVANTDDYNYSKWDTFIDAVIYVESRGNDSAIGDRGKAVGCLQIHPICVREVNRILRKNDIPMVYTLEDRYSRTKSIEMFNIIAEQYECCEYIEFMDYAEIVARRWNGGPKGHKKRATIKYFNKIKKQL
jgi:hypothetical protein